MTEATIGQGTPVFLRDGAQLGEVGETRPDHFQVVEAEDAVGFGSDFWLERAIVETGSTDRLVVAFARDQLPTYRTADPGAAHVVLATSKHDAYIAGATPDEANELADPTLESPLAKPETKCLTQGCGNLFNWTRLRKVFAALSPVRERSPSKRVSGAWWPAGTFTCQGPGPATPGFVSGGWLKSQRMICPSHVLPRVMRIATPFSMRPGWEQTAQFGAEGRFTEFGLRVRHWNEVGVMATPLSAASGSIAPGQECSTGRL